MAEKKILGFTTPLYYVNAKPHMGHLYTTLVLDSLVRWHRMMGDDVYFITGSDEHGQKVLEAAEKMGKKPVEWADGIVEYTKALWVKYGIEYDRFVRTTEEQHYADVQDFFKRVLDNGYIYKGEYSGPYCVPCETFWTESQLVEGNCPECGRPTKTMSEESYFFKLSAFREWLIERIESRPDAIRPDSRRNEILSRLKHEGLRDLSVSRSRMPWGVPLDFIEKGHVCYVWFDALLGYMTAAKYGTDKEFFKERWPNTLHIIGKDILWQHTVIWPAMQKAAGFADDEISIGSFAHGFLIQGGEKMSKSKGNILDPLPLLEIFTPDMLRYFILREVSFGQDGGISAEGIVTRVNSDLANDIGNLLHRSLSMLEKYTGGKIPDAGMANDEIAGWIEETYNTVLADVPELRFKEALESIWVLINKANKFVEDSKPWELAKEADTGGLNRFLYDLVDMIRAIAVLAHPFIPQITDEMWKQLGYGTKLKDVAYEEGGKFGLLESGHEIAKGGPVVPRIDTKEFSKKWDELFVHEVKPMDAKPVEPPKENIDFEAFMKMDLRVAKVLAAERVPKTDKLLKLEIDVGFEKRTIVAGVAEQYSPEDIVGKSIVVLANLAPKKLRGIESKGMLLAAHAEWGGFPLVILDGEARPGSTVS